MSKKIVVMDSGIGGASILREIMQLMPNQSYVYFADTLNSPYGEKDKKTLLNILINNINFIKEKNEIEVLVLACNTASSLCGNELRKVFNFPIICVEPAIKVAFEKNYKNIAILATPQTLKSNKTIKNFQKLKGLKIQKVPLKNLAKDIDLNINHTEKIFNEIKNDLKALKCECAVIGCTHYNFVKDEIKDVLQCEVVSCENAVAQQTKKVLTKYNLKKFDKGSLKIMLSKRNFKILHFLKSYLNFCHN